jgi:hypothetical protein
MRLLICKPVNALIIALVAAVILCCPLKAAAQETRGTIRGTVTDQNGAAVPGAVVTVTDLARGTSITLTTNSEGFYQATYLLPGTYRITVESSGFKKYMQSNVVLQIGQTIEQDVALEVGGTQEVVNVTTDNPPLETAKSDLSQTVDRKRISELPLVHGDPYTLISLSPGVSFTGSARLDRPFEPTHIVGYAIDGTRGNRSDLTIDGAPSTATANANEVIASYVPPTDIIQEFKVQTATFDAQFGNTEGGVTSISIKSGTNQLHGSIYYWTEPGGLAANDFFGNSRGQARPYTYSNRFGGNVNGPVYLPWLYNGHDRTFFLFGYEGIRDSRPRFDAGANTFVPTEALRNGDFSAYASNITIYNPYTRRPNPNAPGQYIADPFPGNIIPQNLISPVAKAILKYYSLPKQPGLLGNIFDSTLTEKTDPYDNFTFRVDQVVNSQNRLFVRGSWYNRDSHYNDYMGTPATGVNFKFISRQGVIDDVHAFNATTVLNVRYGYNRFIRWQDQEEDARGFDLTLLGFPAYYNNLVPADVRRFPRFDFPANTILGTGFSNEFRPIDTHSFSAILNKTITTHSVKFGGELRIYREDSRFTSNDQTGQFIFDNTYTRQNSASGTDWNGLQAFAAFLLGLPTTAQIVRRADYSEYSKTWGFFVQDDWRVNSRLTLNLGLRYEVETPLVERNNKSVSGFDFNYVQPVEAIARARLAANPVQGIDPNNFNVRGGLLFAGKDTGSGLYETPKNTFLPRLGFAYQLNDKTVLRGGFGLFAGFLGQRRGDVIQPGYTRTTVMPLTVNANGAPIPYSMSAPFANITILEPVGNALGRQTGLGTSISFFNQHPKVSKQARWQIGIQRELPGGFVAEAVYVGNYGYDIEISRNINALPNQYLNTDNFRSAAMNSTNSFLTAQVPNPFAGLPEFQGTSLFNATIARSQLLRPYPQFGDITTTNNDGKSWYNAGQFSLQKRFSQGYTVQLSYTFSKWLQATEYLNAGDPKPTKMISDQDAPHRLSVSWIYSPPFGKGRRFLSEPNWLLNALVGGWQLQGVYTYQSGFPVNFSNDAFYNGGKISIDHPTVSRWFNTDAFTSVLNASSNAATPVSHLRTLPFRFSDVRIDPINNVDLSLLKDIFFREEMRLQLRFEAINAFNEPLFPGPVVNPTSPTFGQISASNQNNYARRVQLGIKFLF